MKIGQINVFLSYRASFPTLASDSGIQNLLYTIKLCFKPRKTIFMEPKVEVNKNVSNHMDFMASRISIMLSFILVQLLC